jgi:hypothetical protein
MRTRKARIDSASMYAGTIDWDEVVALHERMRADDGSIQSLSITIGYPHFPDFCVIDGGPKLLIEPPNENTQATHRQRV